MGLCRRYFCSRLPSSQCQAALTVLIEPQLPAKVASRSTQLSILCWRRLHKNNTIMSLRPMVISRVGSLVARQRTTLHASARAYSSDNAPYPFTKPSAAPRKALDEEGPKAAYPFTAASEPTKIATPTRPQEHPGPNNDSSNIISSELNDNSIYGTPDYYAVPDYRTQYAISASAFCFAILIQQ
jgi:hypothetical protein